MVACYTLFSASPSLNAGGGVRITWAGFSTLNKKYMCPAEPLDMESH